MSQTAFLFPGQGSQYVGMGQDLSEAYPEARATFDQADKVLGFALSDLCFNGPEEALNDTINTQPAIFGTSQCCPAESVGKQQATGTRFRGWTQPG